MATTSEAERRWRVDQTVASSRLEGIEPSPEFLADAEDFIAGAIEGEEMVRRARVRWGLEEAPAPSIARE